MKYLVMECRSSYAIVLDEDGNFLRVANMGYEVGQTVERVIKEHIPDEKMEDDGKKPADISKRRRLTRILATAACLCLVLIGTDQLLFAQYGTLRIQINPDVLVSVNRFHYVVGLEGMNEDGDALIEDYSYFGKKAVSVSEELTDRAKQMGYLTDGGNVLLTVQGPDGNWQTTTEETIVTELQHHCSGSVNVSASHEGEEEGAHHGKAQNQEEQGAGHHMESDEPAEELHHQEKKEVDVPEDLNNTEQALENQSNQGNQSAEPGEKETKQNGSGHRKHGEHGNHE